MKITQCKLIKYSSEILIKSPIKKLDRKSFFFSRAREKELIQKSNRLADCLLCLAKDFFVQNDYREVFTPNYDIIFRGKPSSISLGSLRTSQGDFKDLSTLNRLSSWSCYGNPKEIIFFGSFSLKDFKVS